MITPKSRRLGQHLPGFAPDYILLDLMMPGIDGFTVIKELKQDKRLASPYSLSFLQNITNLDARRRFAMAHMGV